MQPRSAHYHFCLLLLAVAFASLSASVCAAQPPDTSPSDPAKVDFFEARIRPILVEHCYECHGPDSRIVQGNLRLDSRQGMLIGGDGGPSVVPGNPQESLVLQSLRYEALEMPPKGKLDVAIVKDFEQWIADGAVDPRHGDALAPQRPWIDPVAAESHWAFQPLQHVEVPASCTTRIVGTTLDSSNPIDCFIGDRLAQRGWSPAPPAEPLVLLRRIAFALTGLPPTLEELDAFLADATSERYERAVDRLLASPQYGVRWGRHWLDTVRYADSNGADENHDTPNAWRYRDWVVSALNDDTPYDEFVAQQVAGDLLVAPNNELERGRMLAATGFWVLGPKMLAEQDKAKMRIDIVDEQIDTMSRTLLGVTLSCARCHDHKFDPFSQADYYALAGILMSTRTMADEAFVSKWMERPLPSAAVDQARADHQARIDAARQHLNQVRDMANQKLLVEGVVATLPAEPKEHYSEEKRNEIDALAKELESLEKGWPEYDKVMAVEEGAGVDLPVHIRGNHLRPGDETIARSVPTILNRDAILEPIDPMQSGRLQLAKWLTHPDHPLLARVMVNRVWMWHFGQGLVNSPSNFGLRGERPSHPELLDWLAKEWIANRWSMKWLHRQILLSQTYQMRSHVSQVHDDDPENQLLWRQNLRRLEIEPMRDAILQCSDRLDSRLQGPGNPLTSPRRTIFLTINRAALADMFSVFDYVDPASHIEQRPVTSVPSQALFQMNSELVTTSAIAMARSIAAHSQDSSHQIQLAFRTLLGRSATDYEQSRSLSFLTQATEIVSDESSSEPANVTALAALVRGLMATREFSWIE